MATAGKYDKILLDYDKHCLRISQATTIRINESQQEKARRMRELEGDYIRWFEYYFPNYAKKKSAWFHKKLANAIIKNKKIKALAEWYRSSAKSVHIDLGIPLYLYLAKSDLKFMLLVGETDDKAKRLISGIQSQLQFNKRIINDYGLKFQYGDWSSGNFVTTDGVRFMSLGWLANPRGAREEGDRPDYIVVDDVDNKRHINNNKLMSEGVDFIKEDVWGCFDAEDDATERFVYANNNFHKNSITNRLKEYFVAQIKEAKENGEPYDFFHLRVDAVKDLTTFEPNWKEKTSADYWRKKYKVGYRSFMREFMNTHISEGSVFKPEWIQYIKILSYDKYDSIVAYGDLSFSDDACHKSIVFVGKIGRQFHILHIFFRQSSRSAVAEWLYDTYEDYKLEGKGIKYIIEGLFAMSMFVTDFDEIGDERGYYIPVTPSKRPKGDKFDRIEAMSGFWERRNVFLNEKEKDYSDQILFRDTMLAFEKGAKIPLDGLDACEGAFSEVNRVVRVDKGNANIRTISRESLLSQSKNRY